MGNIDFSKVISAETIRLDLQERLKGFLAELRYEAESADVALPGGMVIQGTRTARHELSAQHMLRHTNVTTGPLDWKGPQGWIIMSPDMIGHALWVISARISACFRAERMVQELIEAGDISAFDKVEQAFKDRLDKALKD